MQHTIVCIHLYCFSNYECMCDFAIQKSTKQTQHKYLLYACAHTTTAGFDPTRCSYFCSERRTFITPYDSFNTDYKWTRPISFNSAPNFSSITFGCYNLTTRRKRSRSYDLWEANQIVAFNRLGLVFWKGRLTQFYKEKFHWTPNEHWITHIYF